METSKKHNEKGQIIVILALAFVVLLGFAGLAIDGGMIYSDRRNEQNAADAAAMAGARAAMLAIGEGSWNCPSFEDDGVGGPGPIRKAAYDAAISNAQINGFEISSNGSDDGNKVSTACTADYYDVIVVITRQTQTSFIHVIFNHPMINVVHAVARINAQALLGGGYAIISLNYNCSGVDKGMVYDGTIDINITNASVFSNSCIESNGASGVVYTNSEPGKYKTEYVENGNGEHLNPPPVQTDKTIQIDLDPPICPNATGPNLSLDADGVVEPGTYNNFRIGSNGSSTITVELKPGLYCINGDVTINADATVHGENLTFYMVGATSNFKTNGSATIDIAAPPTTCTDVCPPALPGILIYSKNSQENTSSGVFLDGSSSSNYSGTVYAPRSNINIGGTGDLNTIYTQLIGLNVFIHGNSNLVIEYKAENVPTMDMRMRLDK